MTVTGLEALVEPSSVAIVGVSSSPGKHGNRVLRNLRKLGFARPVWGVNPKLPEVRGTEMFPALTELPAAPDLVVCAVPASAVPAVIADAGRVGARAVVVFAGGFAESGEAGRALQARLAAAAGAAGVRLLGPNSGGIIRPASNLAVSFLTCLDRPADQIRPGVVGLVTQSGGTGSYLHNLAASNGGGLAVSVSTGNEADVDLADGIDLVGGLDDVKAIALVVETVRDGERFIAAIRRVQKTGRPVVACRIGRSRRARRMVSTHTGALAVSSRVLDGVLASLGVAVVETPAELLDVAETLARTPVPGGERVGIVTHSGGIAILLADLADREGLDLPRPGPEVQARVRPLLEMGSPDNPLDMGGIIGGPGRFAEVVQAIAGSGEVDAVLAVSTAHPPAHTVARVEGLLAMEAPVPVVHLWMAGDLGGRGLASLRTAGAAVVEEPRAAVRAMAALVRRARPHPWGPPPVPHAVSDWVALPARPTEHDLKGLLAGWGLDVVDGGRASTPGEAAEIAEALGGPVAIKVVSADVAHKTEAGGVRLGVAGGDDARRAFHSVIAAVRASRPEARIEGARVERMCAGLEAIVGCARDPVFGPVVMVGLGGLAVEAVAGVALAPAPVAEPGARRLIERAPGLAAVLARLGSDDQPMSALVRVVTEVSLRFVGSEWPELEINPLVWSEGRWWVVDAMVAAVSVRPSNMNPREGEES